MGLLGDIEPIQAILMKPHGLLFAGHSENF